ncbi:uncharacterized protein LOC109534794 [Dendroctonus ponderosae]|nr:uncharacterized protein LOC109534794 [Dendroctonus ponderosae]KAH1004698.1 hypothetical protein HUJ05_005482 [Dendroctonus ponderosae]
MASAVFGSIDGKMHVNSLYIVGCLLLLVKQSCAVTETSPLIYPFHAVVDSIFVCSALLISDQYVLCPAQCVNGSSWGAKIFLGFNADAFFQGRLWQKDTEVAHASNIIVHDKFVQVSNGSFMNNIALLQLTKRVSFRKNIRPGVLMAKEELQLLGEVSLNVTGWSTDIVSNLSLSEARLLNKDYCNLLYQPNYFPNQEACMEWEGENSLTLTGNLVSTNQRVLGFVIRPACLSKIPQCLNHNKIVTIPPFLDWVSRQTNISIQELTTFKTEHAELIERMDDLLWMLQETDDQHFKDSRRLARMDVTLKALMEALRQIRASIEDGCVPFFEP